MLWALGVRVETAPLPRCWVLGECLAGYESLGTQVGPFTC